MGEATWVNRGGHRLDRGSWSSVWITVCCQFCCSWLKDRTGGFSELEGCMVFVFVFVFFFFWLMLLTGNAYRVGTVWVRWMFHSVGFEKQWQWGSEFTLIPS